MDNLGRQTLIALQTNKRKRNGRIVNLRVLAILLVVFGHSIILYSSEWGLYSTTVSAPILDLIKSCINVIQMPLFISLSGYLYYYSYKKSDFIGLVSKKAKRLLVPFIAIAIFWMIPIRKIIGYNGYAGKSFFYILWNCIILGKDSGHLWFLPCLFFCFLLTYIVLYLFEKIGLKEYVKYWLLFVFSVFTLYAGSFIPAFPGSDVLVTITLNWVWFCTGFLFCYYDKFIVKIKKYWIVMILVLGSYVVLSLIHIMPNTLVTVLLLLIVFYVLVPDNTNKIVELIDKNSFGIYLLHSPLIYITFSLIPNSNPIFVVLLNFIVFGGLTFILTVLLRKTKLKVLLGE